MKKQSLRHLCIILSHWLVTRGGGGGALQVIVSTSFLHFSTVSSEWRVAMHTHLVSHQSEHQSRRKWQFKPPYAPSFFCCWLSKPYWEPNSFPKDRSSKSNKLSGFRKVFNFYFGLQWWKGYFCTARLRAGIVDGKKWFRNPGFWGIVNETFSHAKTSRRMALGYSNGQLSVLTRADRQRTQLLIKLNLVYYAIITCHLTVSILSYACLDRRTAQDSSTLDIRRF